MKFSMMSFTIMRQKNYTVADVVNFARKFRMDGIDWVTTHGVPATELKLRCDDAGLPVVAHTFMLPSLVAGDGSDYSGEAERSIQNAVTLGAPLVMIPPVPIHHIDGGRSEQRRRWIDALSKIAPLATAAGITLTLENFPMLNSPFVTSADFYEAKRQIPTLKLTFDDGNCFLLEDPVTSISKCFDDIAHVHFKDLRPVSDDGMSAKRADGKCYIPVPVGSGIVDTRGVFCALRDRGYCGYANIEYEGNAIPAPEAVETILRYLRRI